MAIFDDKHVYIVKDSKVMLHGFKDNVTRLYMVNIIKVKDTIQPRLSIKHMKIGGIHNFSNNAYDIKKKEDLISYYHTCCFSPFISTWVNTIKNGNFCTLIMRR